MFSFSSFGIFRHNSFGQPSSWVLHKRLRTEFTDSWMLHVPEHSVPGLFPTCPNFCILLVLHVCISSFFNLILYFHLLLLYSSQDVSLSLPILSYPYRRPWVASLVTDTVYRPQKLFNKNVLNGRMNEWMNDLKKEGTHFCISTCSTSWSYRQERLQSYLIPCFLSTFRIKPVPKYYWVLLFNIS